MKFKILTLTFLIISNFIGAGFASGKEIYEFYARFGIVSIFFIIIFFVVLQFLINYILKLGKKNRDLNIFDYIILKNRYLGKIINYCIIISYIFIISSMLAGTFSLGNMYNCGYIVLFFMIVISIIFTILDLKYFEKLNFILIPAIIIIILIVSLFNILDLKEIGNACSLTNFLYMTLYGINYIFLNIFSLGPFLFQIGKNYSDKSINKASILVSAILSILLIIVVILLNLNGLNYDIDAPLASISGNISNFTGILYALCYLFAIFTSIICSCYILLEFFKNKINKYKAVFIIFSISFIISRLGFSLIVRYLYFCIGLCGIFFIYTLFSVQKNAFFKKDT